jgi:hypothetical protein
MSKKRLTKAQKEWIAALRSDEYTQTTEALEDSSGYCCLGVACKVAEKHDILIYIDDEDETLAGDDLFAQKDVKNWLGLNSDNGRSQSPLYIDKDGLEYYTLISLNDCANLDFKQIADIIENNSKELFVTK